MCHLYNGFDEGNISLKTWGAMQEVQTTSTFISPGPRTWKTPELAKFVGDDLFNILTECKAWSSPIPAETRQGIAIRICLLHTPAPQSYWHT